MKSSNHTCNCGNVNLTLSLAKPLESYTPRACDCDFCVKRKIAYLSDRNSKLEITCIKPLKCYQHGSRRAKFLACAECEQVIAVVCKLDSQLIGAVNATLLNQSFFNNLRAAQVSSPKLLSENEKVKRWEQLWMKVETNHLI